MAKGGIYKIIEISTGDFYIGSTVNFKQRWRKHLRDLNNKNHDNYILQSIYNKGEELKFEIYFVCCREDNIFFEQRCLDILRPKINLALDATAPFLGRKHSNNTLEKMRKSARRGDQSPTKRPEVRAKMRENSWMKTEEGKSSVSGEKHAGAKLTKEQAIEILYSSEPTSVLAKRFNISASIISRIKSGVRWASARPEGFIPTKQSSLWYVTGKDHPSCGQKNAMSKLTEKDILEIRNSKESQRKLAERYGVTQGSISNIKLQKTWKHVA